jgi:hypothetical protein
VFVVVGVEAQEAGVEEASEEDADGVAAEVSEARKGGGHVYKAIDDGRRLKVLPRDPAEFGVSPASERFRMGWVVTVTALRVFQGRNNDDDEREASPIVPFVRAYGD